MRNEVQSFEVPIYRHVLCIVITFCFQFILIFSLPGTVAEPIATNPGGNISSVTT